MPGAEAIHPIKPNGADPQRYLADLLARLVEGRPNSRIDELMPWCWAKSDDARTSSAGEEGAKSSLTFRICLRGVDTEERVALPLDCGPEC